MGIFYDFRLPDAGNYAPTVEGGHQAEDDQEGIYMGDRGIQRLWFTEPVWDISGDRSRITASESETGILINHHY